MARPWSEADARRLCAEFDIEVVAKNVMPKSGQTRALGSIGRIILKRGEAHTRLVLSTLMETKNNQSLITETSLWAVSDLVLACSQWIDEDLSSWYDAWDKIPMGFILWNIQELAGKSNMRFALSGALYIMLVHYSRGKKANKEVSFSFVQRMLKAEGQTPRDIEKREAIERGRELIEIRDTMPRGEWIEWVKDRAGYSYETVQRYMRMAREAKAA